MKCAFCDRPATSKWTVNNGLEVGIADLCSEHAQPLLAILEKGVIDAPRDVIQARTQKSRPAPPKGRGQLRAFDWTPPTGPPARH